MSVEELLPVPNNGEDQQHEENDPLFLFGGFLENDSDEEENVVCYNEDLSLVSQRLMEPFDFDNFIDYRERRQLVMAHMGTMAKCRGTRGDALREGGALRAALWMLDQLQTRLPTIQHKEELNQEEISAMELAIACLGALRDLACGNALNRSAIREYAGNVSGLKLLALHVERYHELPWMCMDPLHLKLLTSVTGVMRNVTHSTRDNCIELHRHGVSNMLAWRLLSTKNLPDASQPWREAAYRSAGTLINMSEKCNDCAYMCGSNALLVSVLIEAWGGSNKRNAPLLHLGLAAILHHAKQELPACFEEQRWGDILAKEAKRRRKAQIKEQERKQRIQQQIQ